MAFLLVLVVASRRGVLGSAGNRTSQVTVDVQAATPPEDTPVAAPEMDGAVPRELFWEGCARCGVALGAWRVRCSVCEHDVCSSCGRHFVRRNTQSSTR